MEFIGYLLFILGAIAVLLEFGPAHILASLLVIIFIAIGVVLIFYARYIREDRQRK